MKNEIICRSCNTANAPHNLNCSNCKSYLRDRVVNIDLWHTFSLLTTTPSEGFKIIRNSEHKNFIILLFALAVFKLLHNTMFLSMFYTGEPNVTNHLLRNFLVVAGIFLVITIIFSISLKIIAGLFKIKIRFWDNLALFLYSFFPYGLAFVIFLPLEYVVFAEYMFSNNPSWFALNPPLAYLFTFLEGSCVLWSAFLLYCGVKTQTNSKLFSLVFSLVFIFITYLTYFVVSKYLFM